MFAGFRVSARRYVFCDTSERQIVADSSLAPNERGHKCANVADGFKTSDSSGTLHVYRPCEWSRSDEK